MYSGAIDGRPESAYSASNSALSLRKHGVGHPAHFAQRMIRRHSLLQRHIAEHPVLNPLVSSHIDKTNRPGAMPRRRTYFNKFLGEISLPDVKVVDGVAHVEHADFVFLTVKLWDTQQAVPELVPLAETRRSGHLLSERRSEG